VTRRGLAEIVRALGGDLYAGGARACVPGPGHSRTDRSVSLALDGGRVLIHSFAGDDWRRVRDDLRKRRLLDDTGKLLGAAPPIADAGPPPPGARIRAAARLWSQGSPVAGTPADRHLRGRGLCGPWSRELRSHPSAPSALYLDHGTRRPALMAAIRDTAGELTGVEVTYLTALGQRAHVPTPRKTIGRRPLGAAVRLHAPGAELLVAEGVPSALSAARLLSLPAWALLAAGALALWTPPPGVTSVVIAADRDPAGARAAWRLLRRLRQAGLACRICWPPAPHRDWNEALLALLAAREGEEGTERAGMADGWSGSLAP
jgi:putative DNA primase/helicase